MSASHRSDSESRSGENFRDGEHGSRRAAGWVPRELRKQQKNANSSAKRLRHEFSAGICRVISRRRKALRRRASPKLTAPAWVDGDCPHVEKISGRKGLGHGLVENYLEEKLTYRHVKVRERQFTFGFLSYAEIPRNWNVGEI